MLLTSLWNSSGLGCLLALCLVTVGTVPVVFAEPITAPVASSSPWSNLTEAQRKEYENGMAARKHGIGQLPKDSVVALDVPYVKNPVQGKLPVSSQTLDLYAPKASAPLPLIIWIHGGAGKGGNKEQQGADLAAK